MVLETIESETYVLGITKATVQQSLYKLFYNRLINKVEDTNSPARSKWWYPAWPDVDINSSDSYPIGIIESPDINWSKYTLTKRYVNATITIEIYSNKQKDIDILGDRIVNAIETSRTTFRDLEIRFLTLTDTSTSHRVRDKITVHSKMFVFDCRTYFNRTL